MHYIIFLLFIILQSIFFLVNDIYLRLMIISLIGFIIITIGGRMFFITRDKFGWLTTSLFHMGVDLGIVAMAIYKIQINGE